MNREVIFLLFFIGLSTVNAQAPLCYEVFKNLTGLSLYDDLELDKTACKVENAVDSNNFKVLGMDLYPILGFKDKESGYDTYYQKAYAEVDSAYDGFILISKEIDPAGRIDYKVDVKYGEFSAFEDISLVDQTTIVNVLNQLAKDEYERLQYNNAMNAQIETEVLNAFLSYVTDGVDEDFFEEADFEPIEIAPGEIDMGFTGTVDTLSANYHDLAGVVDASTSGPITDLVTESLAGPSISNAPFYIFTSSSTGNYNLALRKFNSSTNDYIVWIHFESNDQASYKLKSNISVAQAQQNINAKYEAMLQRLKSWDWPPPITTATGPGSRSTPECSESACEVNDMYSIWGGLNEDNLRKFSIYCCVLQDPFVLEHIEDWNPIGFQIGLSGGVLDGLINTLFLLYDLGSGLRSVKSHTPFLTVAWWQDAIEKAQNEGSFLKGFHEQLKADTKFWSGMKDSINKIWDFLSSGEKWKAFFSDVWKGFKAFLGDLNPLESGLMTSGYTVGLIAFEIIITAFTAGTGQLNNLTNVGANIFKTLSSPAACKAAVSKGLIYSVERLKKIKCIILAIGCFVKHTPILMASKTYHINFGNTAKAMAVAASMPIVAVPIQDVQLLDYAVAHETVNADYGLMVSVDDDIYLGLTNKDPYTSNQQRERDQYEINDTDWNEVVFEQVNGSSIAKLALNNDWINQKGYQLDAIVNLNLPEQGISGPFRITSIKHIIPQKKPIDDDESDDYNCKPVTGLFIHSSSEVWNIKFDNGEELGVTHNHPIFSTTLGDWQFAGMLQIGEEVLTKYGGTKVISKQIDKDQEVYNLEVKDYHNFLVSDSGIVVHNNGLCDFLKSLFSKYSKWHKAEPDWGLNDNFITEVMGDMVNNPQSIKAVTTTTYNGKTYLIDGHHRLKAAKRLKAEQGIDFEIQHMDINPNQVGTLTPYNNIDEFIQNTFLPGE